LSRTSASIRNHDRNSRARGAQNSRADYLYSRLELPASHTLISISLISPASLLWFRSPFHASHRQTPYRYLQRHPDIHPNHYPDLEPMTSSRLPKATINLPNSAFFCAKLQSKNFQKPVTQTDRTSPTTLTIHWPTMPSTTPCVKIKFIRRPCNLSVVIFPPCRL
jgi:hypothetical protein